jgi:hypothetical protein
MTSTPETPKMHVVLLKTLRRRDYFRPGQQHKITLPLACH